MRHLRTSSLLMAAALFGTMLLPSAAGAGQATYPYTVNIHGFHEDFVDEGICGGEDHVIADSNFVLHVNASTPGLSDDDVLALLEDDPGGVIQQLTLTETGTFTLVIGNGDTYTGRFTTWFGGVIRDGHAVFTGTFSVRGRSADGSRLTVRAVGHSTIVGGEPVVEFDKFVVKGCPVA